MHTHMVCMCAQHVSSNHEHDCSGRADRSIQLVSKTAPTNLGKVVPWCFPTKRMQYWQFTSPATSILSADNCFIAISHVYASSFL